MDFKYYKFLDYILLIVLILAVGYQIVMPILKYNEIINISWWWCFIPMYMLGLFLMWLGILILRIEL